MWPLLLIAFLVPLAVYRGTHDFLLIKLSLTQGLILLSLILWLRESLRSGKGLKLGFATKSPLHPPLIKGERGGFSATWKFLNLKLMMTPLARPLLLFFFLALLSLAGSAYRWAGPAEISRLATYLLLYGLIVHSVRDKRSLSGLVGVWLLSTGMVSFYGLYQHFFAGITPPRSTLGNANFFAAYLVLPFPLVLTLFINNIFSCRNSQAPPHPRIECGAGKSPLPWWERVRVRGRILSLAVLLLAMTLSLFLVSSRGAWLGLAVSLIFLGWLSCLGIKRRRLAARVIPAFLLLLFILTAFLIPRFLEKEFVREELERGTTGLRLLIWEGTARMIAAHPFLGSGIGSFQVAYPKHRLPEYFRHPHAVCATAHAHNEFLQIAAEMGIPGLAAFLWILIIFFKKGIELVRKEGDREKRVLMLGLISGVAGLLATNLVGVNLRFPSSAIFLWLAMGLVMSQSPPLLPSPITLKGTSQGEGDKKGNSSLSACHAQADVKGEGSMTKLSLLQRRALFGFALLLMLGVGWPVVVRPFLAERHFQRGINYRWAGNWERAISQYHRSLELAPFFLEVHYRLGFAYAMSGELDRAISAYEKLIDLAPDFARVQANIAFLYKKRGDWGKAIQAYQRALKLNPYDTKSIHYLQKIYEEIDFDI